MAKAAAEIRRVATAGCRMAAALRLPALSPIAERRLARFRANRRGVWALWIFLALFLVTLPAEFVANDRPLFVWYEGKAFFPVLSMPDDTHLGGSLGLRADFQDPDLNARIAENGFALWPLIPYRYDTHMLSRSDPAPAPPDSRNWLGTDDQHRDVLARLVYGFRISVLFGLALTLVASVVGIAAGAVQGYFGGLTDLLGQRFIEIWASIPTLYVIIILASVLTPSFALLLGILALFSWTALVGVVRAEFLRTRNFDYVTAARALGLSHGRIMLRHVLPNATVAALTLLPFVLNGSITTLTALDFLGFGMPPDAPSLGELLRQGKNNLHAPWLGVTAFLAIAIILSLLVFIGEAVRDAFDPRKAER